MVLVECNGLMLLQTHVKIIQYRITLPNIREWRLPKEIWIKWIQMSEKIRATRLILMILCVMWDKDKDIKSRIILVCTNIYLITINHHGLLTPNDLVNHGQYWDNTRLVAWRHQATTYTPSWLPISHTPINISQCISNGNALTVTHTGLLENCILIDGHFSQILTS